MLQPANGGYLPIYDTNTGSYKFFAHDVVSHPKVAELNNGVKYYFRVLFDNAEAYKIIANSSNDSMDVVVKIAWTGVEAFEIKYTMESNTVKEYASRKFAGRDSYMTLTIYGLDSLDAGVTISATPTVVTTAGVTSEDVMIPYQIG